MAWTGLIGLPRLPAARGTVSLSIGTLPVVADNDPAVFLRTHRRFARRPANGKPDYLLLGLHKTDPLLSVAENRSAICYTTRLYLVCWQDGESLLADLDERVPYLELGSL